MPSVPLEYDAQACTGTAWQVCSRGRLRGGKRLSLVVRMLLPSDSCLVKMEDGQKYQCTKPGEELLVPLIESLL